MNLTIRIDLHLVKTALCGVALGVGIFNIMNAQYILGIPIVIGVALILFLSWYRNYLIKKSCEMELAYLQEVEDYIEQSNNPVLKEAYKDWQEKSATLQAKCDEYYRIGGNKCLHEHHDILLKLAEETAIAQHHMYDITIEDMLNSLIEQRAELPSMENKEE